MGNLNLKIGGISLDNGSWRRIFGNPTNIRSGGIHTITVAFHIEADNADTLETRWQTTVSEFTTRYKTSILYWDDGTVNFLESIVVGTNGYRYTESFVSMNPAEQHTAFAIEGTVKIDAQFDIPDGTGQVSDFVVITNYDAGRVASISLNARYNSLAEYTAARSNLQTTYLQTDADGGRNSSSALALISEQLKTVKNDSVEVTIISDQVYDDLSAESALRSSNITIQSEPAANWLQNPNAGNRPTRITATGTVTVDATVLSGQLHKVWDKVKANVKSVVQTQVGKSVELINFTINSNRQASTFVFEATYLADNISVFSYRRTDTETQNAEFVSWVDADGFEKVQKRPGDDPIYRSISINRTGVGRAFLFPAFGGIDFNLERSEIGTYILLDRNESQEGPMDGEVKNIYAQQGTYVFRRFNFKPFDDVSVTEIGV